MRKLIESLVQRSHRSLIVVPLFLLMTVAICPAEAEDDGAEVYRSYLRAAGVSEQNVEPLLKAFENVAESGSVQALIPFFTDSNPATAFFAATTAFQMEPEKARTAVIKLLKEKKGDAEVLLSALSGSYDTKTIEYLIERLQNDRANEAVILFSRRYSQNRSTIVRRPGTPGGWKNVSLSNQRPRPT